MFSIPKALRLQLASSSNNNNMQVIKHKTALITGASSGIGKALAYELAAQGTNLILTARSKATLEEIAADISKIHPVSIHLFTEDLAQPGAAARLTQQIQHAGLQVDILINNAGFGKWNGFLSESLQAYSDMMQLNMNALVELTYLLLPDMVARKSGAVINVASTGAFQPCPYIAVYCASKAFVLSFSEALHGEFTERGITVQTLCPGNTQTGFQSIAGANTSGMPSVGPEVVAKTAIRALKKGSMTVIPGLANYLQTWLARLMPRTIVVKVVKRMMMGRVTT